jgi:hypothetical protein
MYRQKGIVALTVAAHWVLWLIYTNNPGYREMIAGTVAALLATVGVVVFGAHGKIRFRLRAIDVLQVIRLPAYVVTDTAKLLRAIGEQMWGRRGAPSCIEAVEFDALGNDASSAGRRALAVTYGTISPNSVLVGVVTEQGLLLYHRIQPGRISPMLRHLGARL